MEDFKGIDLRGMEVGMLTVISHSYSRNVECPSGNVIKHYWRCVCECGAECDVEGGQLRRGKTRTCGSVECSTKLKRIKTLNDVKGIKYGRITISDLDLDNCQPRKAKFKGICECGNEVKNLSLDKLRSGHTKSCGCLISDKIRKARFDDISGKKFHRLTVTSHAGYNKNGHIIWNCICDCGNTCVVEGNRLKQGNNKSCGCLVNELGDKYRKMCLKTRKTFGDALIDKYGKYGVDKYWSDKNTISIHDITRGNQTTKIWIKCDKVCYHDDFETTAHVFLTRKEGNNGCPYCTGRKVDAFDSLGNTYEDSLKLWSIKNDKTPYEYTKKSSRKVWWKCPNGEHEDYCRTINDAVNMEFRCPKCQYSKGEKRILDLLSSNVVEFIPQKEFNGLVGMKGFPLSYDFYLPLKNVLIEYQGEFHDNNVRYKATNKSIKYRKEHDRRKKQYAIDNNIKLLEIWYGDYDNIEEILRKENIIN